MSDFLHVYTWREGLLARVGHDLRLSARRFAVGREGDHFVVRVPAEALAVDGAMKDGRLEPMSDKDRHDIEAAMRDEVLQARLYPSIQFRGEILGSHVSGELTLHGQTHPLSVPIVAATERVRGEVEFAPSRWGIHPYRALLGALRLEDRVGVAFDVAIPREGGGG